MIYIYIHTIGAIPDLRLGRDNFHRKTDRRQDCIRFSTFYRANVAELLHAERVCHLLTEVCFGDPGLGFQPSDLDPDLTARVLLRGASWPRLLSGYEEIEASPGWKPFGVMERQRAPFRWGNCCEQPSTFLYWYYVG